MVAKRTVHGFPGIPGSLNDDGYKRVDFLKPLMSSEKMDWMTPPEELAYVREVGPIGLDPCTTEDNPVGATFIYTPNSQSGLTSPWTGYGLVFANPPYGRELPKWVAKCQAESDKGAEIIALVPARTDTRWWHAMTPDAVCFRKGRIRFVGAPASAPFPSAYIYWGPNVGTFGAVFYEIGRVV